MIRVAVVVAECGSQNGGEIFETVFTLLELDRRNIIVSVFAPDQLQQCIINHLTQEKMPETRNVLVEAACIAREGTLAP